MADTIEITGLEERIRQFGEASTKNPLMQKRIQEVIRTQLVRVRKALQSQVASGLDLKSDPRGSYKAIRMSVYKKIFGGNVSILSSRRRHGTSSYEPPRTLRPGQRGGNRRVRSERTKQIMSYSGIDREFILRFQNQGTEDRYTGGRNGNTRAERDTFIQHHGGRGYRGNIAGKDWFGNASQREIERAAAMLDEMINDIVQGIMY
jgi:hypothetical protein